MKLILVGVAVVLGLQWINRRAKKAGMFSLSPLDLLIGSVAIGLFVDKLMFWRRWTKKRTEKDA